MHLTKALAVCALPIAATSWLAAATAQAADTCRIGIFATMDVTMVGLQPVVGGTINGKPVRLLADSGAFFSMLNSDAAQRLGVKLGLLPIGMGIRGVAGEDRQAHLGTADTFTLDGLKIPPLHKVEFVVSGGRFGQGVDGLIGQNVLRIADIEYDLANGKINLIKATDCGDKPLAYWSPGGTVAELSYDETTPAYPHLVAKAKLNGHSIRILFDTGAAVSGLGVRAAHYAGFKRDDPATKPAGLTRGIGPREIDTWLARFEELDLGGEKIKNVQLRVADLDLPGNADMLLGADFFLSHHLYISKKLRKIWFTFNGGHVFDLSVSHNTRDEPAPDAAATPAGAPDGATSPTTADAGPALPVGDLRRRAAASVARGDLASAMSHLDAAIRQAPDDADTLYQRAQLRLRRGDADGAGADLDHLLQVAPRNIEALVMRARKRMEQDDFAGSDADFKAAMAAAPPESELQLQVASYYGTRGHYNEAITLLDDWIATRPDDDRMRTAHNNRCWERAVKNVELELALADCNAAVNMGKKEASLLDSRGLVWLRMARYDKAISDYDAAVSVNPKFAGSLFGLAIAESHAGQKGASARHQKEALAINPRVAESFKKMGLGP
jgi:predicted aspartyl protease